MAGPGCHNKTHFSSKGLEKVSREKILKIPQEKA